MPQLSCIDKSSVRTALNACRSFLLAVFCVFAAALMPLAALAQSATVAASPSSFTSVGQQITITYTIQPGSYFMTSITGTSQIKGVPVTCQAPNGNNPFTCSSVYTVDVLDDMSGTFAEFAVFTGTRQGGNFNITSPTLFVPKSGGGPVSLSVFTSPNPSAPGSTVTVSATISSMGCNAGLMPPGSLVVTVGPESRTLALVQEFSYSTGDTVSFTTSALAAGNYPVSAQYAGGGGCAASTVSGTSHTVEPQPTVTIGTATQTGDSLAFPVSFSAPVSGFTASDVTVASTAGATSTTVTGSGASYTATITGMTQTGNVAVSVAVNRASTAAGSQNLASNTSTFAYTPMTLDAVSVPEPLYGQPYSFGPFAVSNGTGPFAFTVSAGALPGGITLSSGGVLSGTTVQTGPFTFTARAVDANGRVATRAFSFTVSAPTISVAPTTLPSGTFGAPYSQTVTASGGAEPYFYDVTSGALPPGLVLNTLDGTISGTPSLTGTFNVNITATVAGGFSGTRAYSLIVNATVPSAPQGVLVAVSGTSGVVTFSPPASDGGSAVMNYNIIVRFGASTVTFTSIPGSPYTLNGLQNGVTYAISVVARNAAGLGPESAQFVITPKAPQTITFANPGAQNFGTTPTLTATASSGLPVILASQTTGVCTIEPTGLLTFLAAGTCTIDADQPGDGTTEAAVTVTRSFSVNAIVPSAPLSPVATAGDTSATVVFTAPSSNGGSAILGYTVTAFPGGLIGTGPSSPITMNGLTNGVSYTFTVDAYNGIGSGPPSAPSNAVTPLNLQTITFTNPGAQTQFTTPTLTASASSGLPVVFTSTTTGVCTIAPTGLLTLTTPGTCTIEASQPGDASFLPAPTVSRSFSVLIAPPIAANSSVSVPFNSVNNPVPLTLSGGTTEALFIVTPPSFGTLLTSGATATYTPVAAFTGSDSFTYIAFNSNGNSSAANVSITVVPPTPTIAPSTLPAGRVGTAYSATFTGSNGIGIYSFAVTAGTLPGGLTLATDGVLSGTPTASGSFPFTVTTTDAAGSTAAVNLTLQIDQEIPVAGPVSVTVAANSADNPVTLNLSGGTPTSVTIATVALNGTVSVTGTTVTYTPTPGFFGADSFTYIASNSGGLSSEAPVLITVTPPILPISPSVLPQARVGVPYSATLTASLGTAPYTFVFGSGGLPTGITLAPDGTLSGTPQVAGVVSFTVQVFDANGATGGAALDITVLEALPVATNSSLTVAANAGATPVPLTLSGGPSDSISIVTAPTNGTATVTGASVTYTPTPGYSGPDSFTYIAYTAGRADGISAPATVSITVTPPILTLAPVTPPQGRVGTAYVAAFTANLGTAPYSFAVTGGALPPGLTLATNGGISGTPTAIGPFSFTVTATDANGATGSLSTAIIVDEEIPVAANTSLTVTANAGATPVPLALTGGAATAVTLATLPSHGTATVSGTTITYTPAPGYSGPDSFTYTAGNAGGISAPATVSITVTPPVLTVAPPTLPAGRVEVAYTAAFTANLGTAPYSFAVTAGALPGGLTLASDGSLSGTPTAAGSFGFTVTATDALGAEGSVAVTVAVDAAFDPVVPQSFTGTVESNGTIIVDLSEGATGDVLGGRILGVTPPEAGIATILAPVPVPGSTAVPVLMQFAAAADYVGPAQVDFVLVGPRGDSVPAAVRLTVLPATGPLGTGDAFGVASAQADAARRMARDRMGDLHSHMRKLRGADCLSNTASFSLTGPASATGTGGTTASLDSSQCSTLAQGDVGLWVTGSLSFGTWKDTTFSEALDHASRSLIVGMDYRLSDRTIGGIALTLGRDVTDLGASGSETTNRSTGAALYLTYGLDDAFFIDGLIGAAMLDFSSRRFVPAEGVFALGERDGRQVYFSVAVGKDFSTEARDLEGYLRMSGSRSVLEAFTETGATTALRFEEQEVKSLVGAIGFATSTELSMATGTLRPTLSGEISHEFSDAGTIGVSYAGLGGGAFYQRDAAQHSRTEVSLGLGFDFQHMNGWVLDGEVGLRLNGDGVTDTSVKLNWQLEF